MIRRRDPIEQDEHGRKGPQGCQHCPRPVAPQTRAAGEVVQEFARWNQNPGNKARSCHENSQQQITIGHQQKDRAKNNEPVEAAGDAKGGEPSGFGSRPRRTLTLFDAENVSFDAVLESPAAAAIFLRSIHATSGGALLIPKLVHDIADPVRSRALLSDEEAGQAGDSTVLRIAEFGAELLEGDGNYRGAEIASLLLAEVRHALPSKLEETGLWRVLAAQGEPPRSKKEKRTVAGFPDFFVRTMRRGAGIREGRTRWSSTNGEILQRCTDSARALLSGPLLNNPHWHLRIVRCAWHFLEPGVESVRLPPDAGCDPVSLCERVEEIHAAYRKLGGEHPIKTECEEVMSL